MSFIQALVLGILQGITEFLPISSSGHLILLPSLLGWEIQSLAFDTWLHLGTAAALVTYFWKDLTEIIKQEKYLKLVAVGTIPALLLGLVLEGFIAGSMRSSSYVAAFLLAGSLIMWLAERTYKNVWHTERVEDPKKLKLNAGMVIGVFQSLALFSGISRSGSTMSGGMFMGLTREAAAKFSFILSIPIVIAAGAFKVFYPTTPISFDLVMVTGFMASFLTGVMTIKYLLRFLKTNNLYVFIIYRLALAALVLITIL